MTRRTSTVSSTKTSILPETCVQNTGEENWVAQAVSATESLGAHDERQLEGYYDRLARAEARETFSGDVIGLPSFLTTGMNAAITRTDELAKRSVSTQQGDMYRKRNKCLLILKKR